VIDVVIAVITAQGEHMTSNTAQTETASAPAEKTKPHKKGSTGARGANVASPKAKTGKRGSLSKRAPKGRTKVTGARDGSKTAKILDLLRRRAAPPPKICKKQADGSRILCVGFCRAQLGGKWG